MSARSPKATGGDRLDGLDGAWRERVAMATTALRHAAPREAAPHLDAVLRTAPTHPEVLRLRALADLHLGDAARAVERLRTAYAGWPDDGLVATQLGGALAQTGDLAGAERCFRAACTVEPGLVDAWYNLGLVLEARNAGAEARAAFAHAVALAPGHAPACLRLAEQERIGGDLAAAEKLWRAVLASAADSVPAWVGLASLPAWRPDAGELAQVLALRGSSRVPPAHATSLAFACATLLERCGRDDEAFDAYLLANRRKRGEIRWDASAVSALVDAILDAFPETSAEPPSGPGEGIVFIVGMPRSGSTLLEQILASHSMVAAGGERNALSRLLHAESLHRRRPFPQWVAQATPVDWQRLGARYLAEVGDLRGGQSLLTDKTLSNWQLVGAIRRMLPGARIIECVRDPLDTVWSCFRHHFAEGQGFSYDLDELVAFHRDCTRALRTWRGRHPQALVHHDHDALLREPEAAIRAVLDACGLPFDAACLKFHETRREVRTASAAQVRMPLQPPASPARRHAARLAEVAKRLEDRGEA
ncbi:MAG TPA: sulfotransferase [Dokdonella sp.]|uniref:tetratricopeptide repeat-containing sulfotransferase family protein n=1 Tax=Dokdonella sp. TaxID=2291710 RepID=UPI0025B9D7B5|nr:tetratricopeptide repeat-containing sulfotransferase family protein [Dokdonella sp.]MBX3690908.1 sulfotransferase [Dokdonella sp.]MCW5567277.1 sulfotransferase [Dokdonella sp.]HNR92446.1 sulfotransferase [Dokdonella sp.]